MRIDGQLNIPAAVMTNVSDLLGRLNTGDVIKARVLEVTSDEVLLRLFDGSVLKAATAENLEVQAGQTLQLTVTAKAEGTLFLETVRNSTQYVQLKPDMLKSMLAALSIKPDAQNMALAAEFLKAGVQATTEHFNQAADLMKSFTGINAEKAVFITSKGLSENKEMLDLLSRLLDGNLKLGQQLKDLRSAIDNISQNASLADNTSEPEGTGLSGKLHTAGQSGQNSFSEFAVTQKGTESTLSTANGTSASQQQNNLTQNAAAHSAANTAAGNSEATPLLATGDTAEIPKESSFNVTVSGENITEGDSEGTMAPLFARKSATTDPAFPPDGQLENSDTYSLLKAQQASAGNTAKELAGLHEQQSNPFEKLKAVVKELFIDIDSDHLASELDINKFHAELNNRLEMLKAAIQAADPAGVTDREQLSANTAMLDDSMKLLNHLNNNHFYYYQLPVNLSGQDTTAELYVMKRKQSRKTIDPRNTVLFVSLDTNHIGRIETLLDVKEQNVSIHLRTEHPKIRDYIKENIKYLYEGLMNCGFKLVNIQYAILDSASTPVNVEQVLSKMIDSSYSKVDMRI